MLKVVYPNRYLTPIIAMVSLLRKDFSDVDNLSLEGGEADVRVGQDIAAEQRLPHLGRVSRKHYLKNITTFDCR